MTKKQKKMLFRILASAVLFVIDSGGGLVEARNLPGSVSAGGL